MKQSSNYNNNNNNNNKGQSGNLCSRSVSRSINMDQEKKNNVENLKGGASTTPASPTLSTPPTLNLMEQILLAKIEKQNLHESEDLHESDGRVGGKRKKILLRRTDSMDSQNSASTYNSFLSSDSASSGNVYCKCDDCLLGIVDDYQRNPSVVGRKKVNSFTFLRKILFELLSRDNLEVGMKKKLLSSNF